MSDINLFQFGGKAVRRTYEALEDSYFMAMQCTASMLWKNQKTPGKEHGQHILDEAVTSFGRPRHHRGKASTRARVILHKHI